MGLHTPKLHGNGCDGKGNQEMGNGEGGRGDEEASAVQDETKTLTKNQNLLEFKKRAGKSPSQISIF